MNAMKLAGICGSAASRGEALVGAVCRGNLNRRVGENLVAERVDRFTRGSGFGQGKPS